VDALRFELMEWARKEETEVDNDLPRLGEVVGVGTMLAFCRVFALLFGSP
jgi:hypothetical protein